MKQIKRKVSHDKFSFDVTTVCLCRSMSKYDPPQTCFEIFKLKRYNQEAIK